MKISLGKLKTDVRVIEVVDFIVLKFSILYVDSSAIVAREVALCDRNVEKILGLLVM